MSILIRHHGKRITKQDMITTKILAGLYYDLHRGSIREAIGEGGGVFLCRMSFLVS